MIYSKDIQDLYSEFHSSNSGLSESQVEANRKEFGENKLYERKRKHPIVVFLEQFKDLIVLILIIAAVISMFSGHVESTIVIFAVLILNAIMGAVQTINAEKSLDSLKNLSAPTAKVVRNGEKSSILASELVVGDIILLEAGDIVPSDGRIIDNFSLQVNESALTGESESVIKNIEKLPPDSIALGDQKNMVFSSSLVTYGRAYVIITSVGVKTELGKIAELMNNTTKRKTPLQVTIDNFSKNYSIGILVLCGIILAINIYRGTSFLDAMLFAVALAVAAVPEALSSVITISLAIGTKKMAEQHAIIKELKAVEGLGCVSIICSDKTGTLTQNKMTVTDTYIYNDSDSKNHDNLLICSILCNDTHFIEGDPVGDPTETCLVNYYVKQKENYEEMLSRFPRVSELPFDSDRKLMSTLHNIDGISVMYTKGAFDVMIEHVVNLSEDEIQTIREKNQEFSMNGLRVLGFGYKILPENTKTLSFEDENDFNFIGLIAMMDPPREETAQAVTDCISAGITPIMITGDHKITATAIAKSIGIINSDDDISITGPELDEMSEEELHDKISKIKVYARVSPNNKIRIVNAWQDLGQIVAMTGDGVNDAPALKSADIGIAMGITGTDVSKDASSMILTDDNFATIISSVLNGRNIYENIKSAITFLLSGNAGAILVVLFATFANLPNPFTPVHLLFINLITDSLPALALSMEPSNPKLIYNKPRKRDESILTRSTVISITIQGILIGIGTSIAFQIGLGYNVDVAMTMAFATLCLARLWHGFSVRGKESIFKLGLFTNMYTIGAFVGGTLLLSAVLFIPFMQYVFGIATLTLAQVGYIVLFSFLPTMIMQIYKMVKDSSAN